MTVSGGSMRTYGLRILLMVFIALPAAAVMLAVYDWVLAAQPADLGQLVVTNLVLAYWWGGIPLAVASVAHTAIMASARSPLWATIAAVALSAICVVLGAWVSEPLLKHNVLYFAPWAAVAGAVYGMLLARRASRHRDRVAENMP
jgi:hypothetical protein